MAGEVEGLVGGQVPRSRSSGRLRQGGSGGAAGARGGPLLGHPHDLAPAAMGLAGMGGMGGPHAGVGPHGAGGAPLSVSNSETMFWMDDLASSGPAPASGLTPSSSAQALLVGRQQDTILENPEGGKGEGNISVCEAVGVFMTRHQDRQPLPAYKCVVAPTWPAGPSSSCPAALGWSLGEGLLKLQQGMATQRPDVGGSPGHCS